jgi:hypothetical protein
MLATRRAANIKSEWGNNMARKPKGPDGPDYEPFIENLTDQLNQWLATSEPTTATIEPTHEFARRIVGLMRMEQKKWAEKS